MNWKKILKPKPFVIFALALSVFFVLYLFINLKSAEYSSLDDYYNRIDYSCAEESDCVVKDIGNCCGAYPECVNKNSITDPAFVRHACSKEDLGGVCGFPSIIGCRCSDSKCEGIKN
jgi:hypothetical protein